MAFKLKKIADPTGFFDAERRTTASIYDPGSEVIGTISPGSKSTAQRIADPLGLFDDTLVAPGVAKPKPIAPSATRRPVSERLQTDIFAGVLGPTQALTDLRRRRLSTQRGVAAVPGAISAAAKALLGDFTFKSSEDFAAEALAKAKKELRLKDRSGRSSGGGGTVGGQDFGGVGGFGFGGNTGVGTGGDVGIG